MVNAVTVAVNTGQAGLQVNIFVHIPLFRILLIDVKVGMTEVAPVVGHLSYDVKEDLVVVVECVATILYARWNLLWIFRRFRHERVVGFGHISGRARNSCKATGGSRSPAEILTDHLGEIFTLVVRRIGIMAAKAVNFQSARYELAHNLVGVLAFELSGAAAGCVSAEIPGKLNRCQAELLGLKCPRPGAI